MVSPAEVDPECLHLPTEEMLDNGASGCLLKHSLPKLIGPDRYHQRLLDMWTSESQWRTLKLAENQPGPNN